ncbi:MAG: ribosome hibernation-promoting factor, HPF/YfiA family [Actinomycetota bacterium]
MEITIRARDGHVSERLKEFADHKLRRLGRFLSTITTVDVELYEDGSPKATGAHVADLTVATSGPVFRTKGTASDPRASIDMAVERAERRIKEFTRRRSGRPAHSRPRVHAPTMSSEDLSGTLAGLASPAAEPGPGSDSSSEIREGTGGGAGGRRGDGD